MGDTMSPNSLLEVPPSLSNLSLWLPLGPHLLSPALPDSSIQILILLSFGGGALFLCEADLGFILAPFPCTDFQRTVSFRSALLEHTPTVISCHLSLLASLFPGNITLLHPSVAALSPWHFVWWPLWRSTHTGQYGLHIKTFMRYDSSWFKDKTMWITVLQMPIRSLQSSSGPGCWLSKSGLPVKLGSCAGNCTLQ